MRTTRAPRNPFAPIAFVDSLGSAALVAAGVLVYTRLLKLSAGEVGAGLAVAAVAAIVLVLPVSHQVERFSARSAMVVTNLALAGLVLLLLVRGGVVWFAVVLALVTLGQRCVSAIRSAALGRLGEDRILIRARTRSAQNLGITLGGVLAAAAIGTGSPAVYGWLLVADAASYVVCAAMALRLDPVPHPLGQRPSPFAIARDGRFLLACGLNTIAGLHQSLLFVALPLWITHVLHAPAVLIPITAVLNTVMVVLLQARLTRGVDGVPESLGVQARAAVVLLLACGVAAATLLPGGPLQIVLVLVAAAGLTFSEIRQSAAGWGIAYGLSPAESLTQYQALFGLSGTAEDVIGPLLSTFVVLALPAGLGWLVVGALVVVSSGAGRLTAHRWAGAAAAPATA